MREPAVRPPWSVVRAAEELPHPTRLDPPLDSDVLLADLENILLRDFRRNRARLQHRPSGRIRLVALRQGAVILLAIPLLIPCLWLGTMGIPDARWPYPATAAVSLVGALVVAIFHRGWRRRRRRDEIHASITVLYAVSTGSGLGVAVLRPMTFQDPIGWLTIPIWALLALCVFSAIRQCTSALDAAWGHVLSQSLDRVRLDVRRLHPDDRRWMLEERDQAVRILVERGLLPGTDPAVLSTRPLGDLHRST